MCAGITLVAFVALFALCAGCAGVTLIAFETLGAGVAFIAFIAFFTLRSSYGFEPILIGQDFFAGSLGIGNICLVHLFLSGLFGVSLTARGKRNAHRCNESERDQTFPKLFHFTSSTKYI